ncbi:hypothetical protein F5I97DRAFT_1988573, partial [Phlebopus sp. FC_14]
DLCSSIKGMYRILDLITEQGSSGLVDKIIISQDSLKAFINGIKPGAYHSLVKVDFKALDQCQIKPIGIYGSKAEIVRFLLSIGVIENDIAEKLVDEKTDAVKPTLRSGLYIIRTFCKPAITEQVYAIYWPEDLTWDDMASPPVRRNRVTFMRYLTKICDQVMALISDEHAKSIVWRKQDGDDPMQSEEDDTERLFTFEVAKTNEQEEGVSVRAGFKCVSEFITAPEPRSDIPVDPEMLKPRLVNGETRQGIMTVRYLRGKSMVRTYNSDIMNELVLRGWLHNDHLQISETIEPRAVQVLLRIGLHKRFPEECSAWLRDVASAKQSSLEDLETQMSDRPDNGDPQLAMMIRAVVVDALFQTYPTLDRSRCFAAFPSLTENDVPKLTGMKLTAAECAEHLTNRFPGLFSHLTLLHPRIGEALSQELRMADCEKIRHVKFRALREQLLTIDFLSRKIERLSPTQLSILIQSALHDHKKLFHTLASTLQELAIHALDEDEGDAAPPNTVGAAKLLKEAAIEFTDLRDGDFVSHLESISNRSELLGGPCAIVREIAQEYLEGAVTRVCNKLVKAARRIREKDYQAQIKDEVEGLYEREVGDLTISFIRKVNLLVRRGITDVCYLVSAVVVPYDGCLGLLAHRITGSRQTLGDPSVLYMIHLMQLTVQDQHDLQLDSSGIRVVPTPHMRYSHTFQTPLGYSIAHAQLLENDRLLLVLVDHNENLNIILDHLTSIDNAIRRKRHKILHRDKIGQEFLLAFDESNCKLAVVARDKPQLHVFVHDTRGFTASGSTINLVSLYDEGTTIVHACFVCGSEELLLIDSHAVARVFSLITMQFRPAFLELHHVPTAVYSSPDGSCFVVSHTDGTVSTMIAFQWSTFGSTDGHFLAIDNFAACDSMVLSSLARRTAVHLIRLDLAEHSCSSVVLNITRKVTEFTFKEKDIPASAAVDDGFITHNCLMDCHVEVWTRFPVLSAVQRATISSTTRLDRSLLFVSGQHHRFYPMYFTDLVETFEKTSKKPIGDKLSALLVSATSFDDFTDSFKPHSDWMASQFKFGEWITEILCLIPIHLALVRDNRFIPLKNGVYSTEVEKSLLGADINRIVDSISFGWYESIFQSYMADKPVRVVSSMGEQSVGKSFALNHFVDTSFAGSAMRTTEGVWMSVTPIKDALIVALDFEGVHSIERSAQEDTLLVLFNTAISNLVLFRNNFALSRDIAGLFHSFQSSSTILDPVANPSLFQSTLMIIIKDVVDADKVEIVREFSLKFQQIVQDEQDINFISRLHGGKLNIIPWPVIESRDFYKLFSTLKRCLEQQPVTHKSAGEFLHLMKTLMAKLKVNDWGALSQTMAAHRAQLLLMLLPTALAYGLQNIDPEIEPLKNLDTDVPLDLPDTDAQFFIPAVESMNTGSRDQMLRALQMNWHEYPSRQLVPEAEWANSLSVFLEGLVDMRINHVRNWVTSNLTRFQGGHASVMELHRTFESEAIDLKRNVQLCQMQCADCWLSCIQNRLHNGPHDCQTDHSCSHNCGFCINSQVQEDTMQCSMSAGHTGPHVCAVNVHLCGAPCQLLGKAGCLEECIKVVDHDDEEHHCAATMHACGEPCGLSMTLPDGSQFECAGICRVSSDVEHNHHQCDTPYCPIGCQLCKRLCSSLDHFHSFESGAIHLCGQEHPCSQRCTARGVCEIDTTPQSIEAMFTGRHESFQYTKYSQVAKRLKCLKTVPAGNLKHEGSHVHSLDPDIVHFCEERCTSCGYFCTLPLGHSQQEHETSHGSMFNARWSINGPDDESIEIEGRRFSTNDEGAPMMCSLICQSMGRHVHVDYCRAKNASACKDNPEILHVATKLQPDPDRPKDFLTHSLFWKRSGFKDPYSREEQVNFGKCDSMCSGPEHATTPGKPGKPSYCTLPLFHAPLDPKIVHTSHGYISNDGHQFLCSNPARTREAFHIIFLIDRSASMRNPDQQPLRTSPVYLKIRRKMNNRLGAVYTSLYSFWMAREAAAATDKGSSARRDSYTIIMHDQVTETICENDSSTPPDQLLDMLLSRAPQGGNSFNKAFKDAQNVMVRYWSNERRQPISPRSPVIIFLSDGIASFSEKVIRNLFRTAAKAGKPLSLHTISFGPTGGNMQQMIEVALAEQQKTPTANSVPSSYNAALNTVQLAETFLGIAESLRKPRGAL